MNITQKYKLTLMLLPLLLVGCASHPDPLPEGVMSQEQYTQLLTDMYKAEGVFAISSNYQYDNAAADIAGTYDSILKSYGVTVAQIDSTRQYYMCHREQYKEIYNKVIENLQRERDGEQI